MGNIPERFHERLERVRLVHHGLLEELGISSLFEEDGLAIVRQTSAASIPAIDVDANPELSYQLGIFDSLIPTAKVIGVQCLLAGDIASTVAGTPIQQIALQMTMAGRSEIIRINDDADNGLVDCVAACAEELRSKSGHSGQGELDLTTDLIARKPFVIEGDYWLH